MKARENRCRCWFLHSGLLPELGIACVGIPWHSLRCKPRNGERNGGTVAMLLLLAVAWLQLEDQ